MQQADNAKPFQFPSKMACGRQGTRDCGALQTMRLLSERGTDEQYVEAVRAWLANPRGWCKHHIGAFLLLIAMSILLPLLIADGYKRMIGPEAHPWRLILTAEDTVCSAHRTPSSSRATCKGKL